MVITKDGMPHPGTRVFFSQQIDRYPQFFVKPSSSGIVLSADPDEGIWARILDPHEFLEGLDDVVWEGNGWPYASVHFYQDDLEEFWTAQRMDPPHAARPWTLVYWTSEQVIVHKIMAKDLDAAQDIANDIIPDENGLTEATGCLLLGDMEVVQHG
jgi:hypothetical protein